MSKKNIEIAVMHGHSKDYLEIKTCSADNTAKVWNMEGEIV